MDKSTANCYAVTKSW